MNTPKLGFHEKVYLVGWGPDQFVVHYEGPGNFVTTSLLGRPHLWSSKDQAVDVARFLSTPEKRLCVYEARVELTKVQPLAPLEELAKAAE